MKKTIVFILISLILLTSFSLTAYGGIKIWPGKLSVELNKWFDEEKEIRHPIQITNPFSNGVNITTRVENPNLKVITERYSLIPDLSWVHTEPENLYIPPKSSKEVEVVINIPIDQQEMYYNEKWETRVVITSDIPLSSGGGMNFQVELAVKLYIITPKSKQGDYPYIFILLFFIFSIIIVYLTTSYIKKKKDNLKSIYYFKNKK
ncbi:hypothetical protein AYK24_08815 [Thermoplasmatales archaeon SG8-52-4]|nr:MAG: hypothetical protein AYK24_08815 [Thermoplasmatales archaeon SG8-52-4]